ncbi:MFS transporter [Actinomadura macrotermitis]|uniref:Multidrug resistance protein Stp n=1 Tax=Actinomadura macrotermitis TaxID=2585200 RepID=A0A7K0BUZ7_9ACTN|nr:MFS transporter [Actinomadura macrotermitis]MQY05025.1 Multidrug resistance protein Stp [Actinomadura macrotermitis]
MDETARKGPWLILFVLCLGFFMAMLDATIVSISLPAIAMDLGASLDQMLWVMNVYILVIAVLYITGGRLGDILGPRTVYIVGVTVFTLASAVCGMTMSPGQLIAARAFQGVGAALLTPPTIGFIVAVFPWTKLGVAFGVYGGVAGSAAVAGPTLGGLLVESLGWRWIFLVNVPIGLATIVLARVVLPPLPASRSARFDLRGMLLGSTALLALTYGLIEAQRYDWGVVWSFVSIPLLLVGGVVLLAVFVVSQRRPNALMPLALFRHRDHSLMNVMTAACQFALFGLYLPLTIYFQEVVGLSPLEAGVSLIALPILAAVTSPFAGRLADKVGSRRVLLSGSLMFGLGILMTTLAIRADQNTWALQAGLVVTGFGSGQLWAPMTSVAMRGLPLELAGAASGVLNTTRQFGNILGGALVGAVLQNRLSASLHHEAATTASTLPANLVKPFADAIRGTAEHGITISNAGGGTGTAHLAPQAARVVELARQHAFERAFTTALQPALLTCAAALAVAFCCAFLLREPARAAPADATGAPDAATATDRT